MSEGENGSQREEGSEQRTHSTADPRRSRFEWATLAISTALLLGVAGILTHAHFTSAEPEPLIEARADITAARRVDDSYHVPIHVHNRGGAPARDIQIRVLPRQPAGPSTSDPGAEAADLRFDVLPPGSSETATVVLRADPARSPVEARVLSYLTD